MISLRIEDTFLEIESEQTLSIERNSPTWLGDSFQEIAGDVSMPFEVPLTRFNNERLGFLDSLGNRRRKKEFQNAAILIDSNEHLSGCLEIENIGEGAANAKIYAGVGAFQNFKNYLLTDKRLYLSDSNTFCNQDDLRTNMNAALANEKSYVFAPFFDEAHVLKNEYDLLNNSFVVSPIAVPFVRALSLLEMLLAAQGYSLVFKEAAKYRDLFIVCNQTVLSDFKLREILPSAAASEFIKKFAMATAQAVFVDTEQQKLTLVAYQDIASAKGTVLDWSNKVISRTSTNYISTTFEETFEDYNYEKKYYSTIYAAPSGSIEYRSLVPFFSELDNTKNLDNIYFIYYHGLKNAEPLVFNGNYQEIVAFQYPCANSDNDNDFYSITNDAIRNRYKNWAAKLSDALLLTFIVSLELSEIRSFRFYQIIRIFNSNDNHYYHFYVKSIKTAISSSKKEHSTIECLLID